MSEEEKEAIEQIKRWRNYIVKNKDKVNKANDIEFYLRTILNLIDRLQKENEELKKYIKYLNYFRDYNSQLQAELVVERKHSISKDKIKELKEKIHWDLDKNGFTRSYQLVVDKYFEELLGGE